MLKAVIVDDKTPAIEYLRWLIRENCPEIVDIATAISVDEALPLIEDMEPDILFLDIQMPRETGFDLLRRVKKWNFEVIFTTAFNEYAIQAIRFSALDYLLKPVDAQSLRKALDRFKAKRELTPGGEEQYRNFLQNITQGSQKPLKLALPGISEIEYVLVEDIIRLKAERNYTRLYFKNGKVFLSAKTLGEYEKVLRDNGFIRVHKSHLLNSQYISGYDKEGIVKLSDGSEVEVSRRKKEIMMDLFKTNKY